MYHTIPHSKSLAMCHLSSITPFWLTRREHHQYQVSSVSQDLSVDAVQQRNARVIAQMNAQM